MNIRLVIMALLLTFLTACSTTGDERSGESAPVDDSRISPAEMNDIDRQTRTYGATDSEGFQGRPLDNAYSAQQSADQRGARVIYFSYDSSSVRTEDHAIVASHAEFLATHPSAVVTLQGHTDERGSREYNLALGERRAETVSRQLQLLGATAQQIQSISMGEEEPASFGHDESAYTRNRRVEIIYP